VFYFGINSLATCFIFMHFIIHCKLPFFALYITPSFLLFFFKLQLWWRVLFLYLFLLSFPCFTVHQFPSIFLVPLTTIHPSFLYSGGDILQFILRAVTVSDYVASAVKRVLNSELRTACVWKKAVVMESS
jgi:hypothetical protein